MAVPFPLSKEIVKFDRMKPFVAGALSGALGGGAMVAVVDVLLGRHSALGHPFLGMLSARFEGAVAHPGPVVIGVGSFVIAAALVSGIFATLTQRLRKIVPLLFWTALFSCALWIMGDAILITKFPWLGDRLPFLPFLAGAEVFAILSCLQLPLRLDHGLVEVAQRRDSLA